MEGLSFGEQVKIILSRKNMTIKELAGLIQERTGMAMSRQNLTQRLGRDNFQEKDMRMIAAILDCPFRLSIFPADSAEDEKMMEYMGAGTQKSHGKIKAEDEEGYQHRLKFDEEPDGKDGISNISPEKMPEDERDMTIGELYEIHEELKELEEVTVASDKTQAARAVAEQTEGFLADEEKEGLHTGGIFLRRGHRGNEVKKFEKPGAERRKPAREVITPDSEDFEPVIKYNDMEEDLSVGEMNPYTGREYQTNSVRMHPTRIGYVQVYDRKLHQWTDMTEWAFLGYQERKKALLGKEYEPPIYLD
ncbi:hypothetical protein [Mediterraneibacter agrestimuris]|uniref:hypothetical protein n=1 Tax=Mediterraneibacter agrestimuris TaxID=2941333 RepID=UPI00203F7F1E|nr:hypothetical protein [Mediterraneibacter agrestimuris]